MHGHRSVSDRLIRGLVTADLHFHEENEMETITYKIGGLEWTTLELTKHQIWMIYMVINNIDRTKVMFDKDQHQAIICRAPK